MHIIMHVDVCMCVRMHACVFVLPVMLTIETIFVGKQRPKTLMFTVFPYNESHWDVRLFASGFHKLPTCEKASMPSCLRLSIFHNKASL